MSDADFESRLADVKKTLQSVQRDLLSMLDARDMTDDQSEHVEDLLERVGNATSIM